MTSGSGKGGDRSTDDDLCQIIRLFQGSSLAGTVGWRHSRRLETMIAPMGALWLERTAIGRQILAAIVIGDFFAPRLPLGDGMPAKQTFGWYSCDYGWFAPSG